MTRPPRYPVGRDVQMQREYRSFRRSLLGVVLVMAITPPALGYHVKGDLRCGYQDCSGIR